MEALVSRVRAADVFETSELREVIDEFTICFNNHLKKENHNDLSVSSTSITEFTAICTELFVSLRSQIQYLSEFMSLPDPLSSQSDMGKINEVNELLVKLWSPLLQFVKCYPTSDMILSVHASTLTQSLLDSLAPYLSVFQDSSVLCLSSASVGLIDWSTVFPLVSRLGCIAVFWHQTIASDTLSSLYTVLAFFKGYFNLLQFAVNDSDSGLAELIAKFDGVFAKIHTKSNVTSVSRLIPLRRCLTECLVHGSMNANNYVPSPTVSVLRDVPRHVSYPFQLVGLLMWLLCEICSFELPLYTSISVQPALYNYLSFVDLWVHALGEYCSLGSTLVSDAWVFDLLETVTRDVVSRMHSLASSSQPASNQHSEESSQFSQYSTQFQVEVTQKQQQRSLQLILVSVIFNIFIYYSVILYINNFVYIVVDYLLFRNHCCNWL